MPGIIAMAGAAEREVDAAVQALRRRPFHEIRRADDPGAQVSLAVVSERGGLAADPSTGVLAVVDGELYAGGRILSEDAAAGELLRLYLAEGAGLRPPDGWFSAAFWDPRSRALVLLTDLVGQQPLYVARSGRRILAAGELKALAAAGLECRLDLAAWSQLLAYEFALGDRTPLAGVRLVPPASALELPLAGGEKLHERWRYRLQPSETGDERELVEELGRLVERAVTARLDGRTALALSGGLDSRTILSTLLTREPEPLLVSYGVEASDDLRLAEAAAIIAGLPRRSLRLEPGYLARGAHETVWLGEGNVRCFHSHHLALRGIRDDDVRTLLIGFAGDPVFRAYAWSSPGPGVDVASAFHSRLAGCIDDDLAATLLTPHFAAQLRGVARDSVRVLLDREEGDDLSRIRQFIWNHSQRRKVLPGALLFADDLAARDPLSDAALIEFCTRMPNALRQGGALQRAYLDRFPDLASLRNPKDGLAPRLRGRRRRVASAIVKARRRTHARLDEAVGFRWLPNRYGIGDYARDLRGHGRPVLELLLEPRTLERGQLREEPVRRLVDELYAGRRRNTRALGMLLTLELFQRQFLDGDEAPASRREDVRVAA